MTIALFLSQIIPLIRSSLPKAPLINPSISPDILYLYSLLPPITNTFVVYLVCCGIHCKKAALLLVSNCKVDDNQSQGSLCTGAIFVTKFHI